MDQIPPGTDLCTVPAGVSPSGDPPNFVNPVNLEEPTLIVGILFVSVSTILVFLRLIANRKKLQLPDYFTIVGWIGSVVYTAVVIALRRYSRHHWDVPACWYVSNEFWKLIFAQNLILGLTQFFSKSAILILYFRLFAVNRKMRWVILAGLFFGALLYLPYLFLAATLTVPWKGEQWKDLATNGRAQRMTYFGPIHGVCGIFLDIYILVVPLFIVNGLHMTTKKRLQLASIFSIALLGVIASVFACYWRFIMYTGGKEKDYTWAESQLFIWVMIEHDSALIVGCMPAVAALIRVDIIESGRLSRLLSKTFSTFRPTRTDCSTGNTENAKNANSDNIYKNPSDNKSSIPDQQSLSGSYYEMHDDFPRSHTRVKSASGDGWPLDGNEECRGIVRTIHITQTQQIQHNQSRQ
ncbi:hypothetical protein QQS21_004228 [Conoideocrella luteorostrata]|uniref:Rhodopsin domain-containing protein n=1 Tax=Conoideocrella luteorostrata TaxID=1105319 RepID=A0AAJ0CRV6_9HYPO|nr:hypothetical protein QQS21_004228 [Conoideocrella luteorostrata]